jgi:hypothetical protein
MGLFTKKADPISSKAKALNQQISALQSEIKQLSSRLEKPAEPERAAQQQPVVRSTALPRTRAAQPAHTLPREPIFESVDRSAPAEPASEGGHFNDLGIRKYDIAAEWRRLKRFMRGPSAHNPKLVSYLAAGSIRGLQPLRYEKRIARNRFIALTVIFLIILTALIGLFRP